jgi:Holliday junction resolvase RusA-like endonuclease
MREARSLEQWRRFWVPGVPTTKGSKNIGRYGQVYEQGGAKLRDWLNAVAQYAMVERKGFRVEWPCGVELDFYIGGRDKDLDKLERAVWDGLVMGGLLADDKWVTESRARKTRGVKPENQGCDVHIWRMSE